MDFNALRAQTLGSGQDEEAVTVNTRALIDKVLARYSGEWTVLRELLQNAADAGATKVTVKFETIPSPTVPLPQDTSPSSLLKHTVQHHTLKRLVVTNNGQPFNENDWTRLKRIAEGNPDETKIGAFGVGFYSVFADCEEPFVSSGQEAMAFFWKSNALFTRRLKLQNAQASPDTNFVLDYRDTTSAVPTLLPLGQFLANSLTFVGIQNIDLWIDQFNILSLVKKTSPAQDVGIPRDIEPKTSEGLMKVTSIQKEMAQIDGEWMPIIGWKQQRNNTNRAADREAGPSLRKFFSRLAGGIQDETLATQASRPAAESDDLAKKVRATIFLNVDTATIKTFTGAKFNEELERATKKPPPKATKLAVLTAPYIENDTLAAASSAGDIFATVLPTKSGRIFIGFPTHQTTGLSAHISAPSVIPTVERESIDLNARYVRTWNMEMLRAAGIVCRITWATEMMALKNKIVRSANGSRIRMEHITPFLSEAVTTTKNFSFRESTPSSKTGQLLEDAFWTCGKKASIDVLSTCGVLSTQEVRVAPKDLSFVEGVPVLPEMLVSEAKSFVDRLIDFGLITEVTVADIKSALESTPLNPTQLTEFLQWITKQASQGKLDSGAVSNLLGVAIVNDESAKGTTNEILVLSTIKQFLNPSRIPSEMPLPATVMPFKFTRSFSKHDLELLGWEEYQIVPWMRWLLAEAGNRHVLSENQDLTKSPDFSAQIFPLLSKQWDALSQSSKSSLVDLLSSKPVIPTKFGMKKPGDAYFPNVKLFDDLPTITGIGSVKDKVLVALGVRKTVELGVVFDRLLTARKQSEDGSKSTASHVALIQYLTSVRDDIPGADMQRLRNTPICPKADKEEPSGESQKRYKVSELFEPRPQLQNLGLPVLAWPGPLRSGSPEARFLSGLGLRTVPDVPELIDIMARAGAVKDNDLRARAMTYFISYHHTNGYANFDYSKVTMPFLPLENKPDELSTPSSCFVEGGSILLGFNLLKRDLHTHATLFGVKRNPPMDLCIDILGKRPPTSQDAARALFTYFASRLGEINAYHMPRLQDLNFVPVFSTKKEKTVVKDYTSPRNCFLGDSETFGEIFNYVDFGQEANAFLLKCGSKPEPSKVEVARLLVREPARISSTFRNPEKYMALLRSLADSIALLKKNKDLFREMKKAPFLLASKEIPRAQPAKGKVVSTGEVDELEEDEMQGIREWQLTSAENAIIVDEYINYNLFKADILAAPQEESLEDFYYALGSPMLSSLVEEAARHGPRAADQRVAQKLQKQILERSTLFLHEQPAETIKHDAKWLEKNLTVQLVSSISLRKSLKGRDLSHTEKKTAVITQINKEYTLWIVGERPDLYQVSQALVHILLTRPKLHSAITLEMLLKTDLLELRTRGFNVSRILRQKAAEARLAESKRQQALEEEQKQIEEQQKAWAMAESNKPAQKAQQSRLPGGFPDSPDAKGTMINPNANLPTRLNEEEEDLVSSAQKWGSNLVRQLGFGRDKRPQPDPFTSQQSQQAMTSTGQDLPPPYSQQASGQPSEPTGSSVTAPHQLHENLLSAIKKTRPHNSSGIFSRGETNTVSETKSYCDERPSHDLAFVAEIKHGIQMFLPSTGDNSTNNTAFLSSNVTGLTLFADILKEVGDIFALNPRTLNIFNEVGGKTIAFNRNGSIFCNYLYFKQLHEAALLQSSNPASAHADAVVYWWVILCHELAHNLVSDHSSNHSYYTEGFVAQYFGKVMMFLSQRNARVPESNLLE